MLSNKSRSRLMAGASLSAVLTMFGAQPAWADCTIAAGAVTCGTTVTTDTQSDGTTPSTSREFLADTSAGVFTGTVSAGAAVTGHGLAFTNSVGGNLLSIVNDGLVQVDAGITPTVGGSAALDITGTGTTDVVVTVSGTGAVSNLGTGDGLSVDTNGTGNITVAVAGDATATAENQSAISAVNRGTAGNVTVGTAGGTITTGGFGITARITDAANAGSIIVINAADIVGGPNQINDGIVAVTGGLGSVTVSNVGAIGSAADRANFSGIFANITNASSTAALTVTGNEAIFAGGLGAGSGISLVNQGGGTTTIDYTGAIDSGTRGVSAFSSGGGAIDVTVGAITATGLGIDVDQTSTTGTGAISVTANDTISGSTGIDARNAGLGDVSVTTTAAVTGTAGSAIFARQSNIAAIGDVTVTVGAGGATSTDAPVVDVLVAGTGDLTVETHGDLTGTGTNADGIVATHTGTAGNVSITTDAGTTISAGGGANGIDATITSTASTGTLTVTNGADIVSSGAAGTFGSGISAVGNGLGTLTVTNSGNIGSLADRAVDFGILAAIDTAASAAALSLSGTGAIFAGNTGIVAENHGTGTTTVNYTGDIDSLGDGAVVNSSGGGAINVTLGDVTAADIALNVQQTSLTGSGLMSITTNGTISGSTGINAESGNLGGISLTTTELVTGTAGSAIFVNQDNVLSGGGVFVAVGAGGANSTDADAVVVEVAGAGGLLVSSNGDITATGTDAGGIVATHTGTAGNVGITTAGGTAISAGDGATAIDAKITNASTPGSLTVINRADITSSGAAGSLAIGIDASSAGRGLVNVTNTGAIGSTTDRVEGAISASIFNVASSAGLFVTGTGGLFATEDGLSAFNAGTGTTTVNYSGAIDSDLDGVFVLSSGGGAIDVTLGAVTGTNGTAVDVAQTRTTGTGAISVTTNGLVTGQAGIEARNAGLGGITVTTAALVTGTNGSAIFAAQGNAASTGNVLVTVGAGGASAIGADAVVAETAGTGTVTVNSSGPVTSDVGNGIATQAVSGPTNISITGGSVTAGATAIEANSTTGSIAVSLSGGAAVTGGDIGVQASSTAGLIAVNLTGGADVDGTVGIFVNSAAAKTITIGAGSVVSGDFEAIGATGGSTVGITSGGTVGLVGQVAVATSILTTATITNLAGGVMNGRVSLSIGNDSVTNAGTWNADGVQDFSAGLDTLNNLVGGVLNIAAGTSFTGLDTLTNAGTATFGTGVTFNGLATLANTGTLNAASGMALLGGDTAMTNSGTANLGGTIDFAGGADTLANLVGGTVNIASGTTFVGLETLNNNGTFNATAGLTFDGGATTLNNRNAGIFNAGGAIDFGAGADVFNNLLNATFNAAAGTSLLGLETLTNAGTFNALAGLTFDAGNTAMSNTGTANLGGVINFGAGTDELTNLAGATVNAAAGTSLLGLETLTNSGSFNANAGLTFDAGNTAFTNTGTANFGGAIDFGAGADSIVSSGTLNFAAGSSLLGLETLTNSGIVNALGGLTFDATSTTVTNNNLLNLGGTFNLGDGNDSIVNSGSGINAQGTIDFGAGADSFVNNSQLFLTGNLTLAGLETFTSAVASRINLNTFNLTGSAIAFTNNGFIDTNGNAGLLGFTSITNAATGTIDLAAGTLSVGAGTFTNNGTILADEGLSTITGQTGFTNSGTINLRDNVVGDRLTLGTGGFNGLAGSTLLLDVNSTTADVLAIAGAATGSTVININTLNDITINSGGILLVDTGTSTSNTAFTLANTFGTPLIDLSIRRVGADYFLLALPNATALDPLTLINIGQDMWQQSADIYGNYAALKRTDLKAGAKSLGLWGQAYMSRDRIGGRNDSQSVFNNDIVVNQHARTERRGIQVGVDHNFGPGVVGVTAGWQKAEAEVRDAITDVDGKGYNVGAYAILGSATGLYGGLLIKYDRNTLDMDNDVLDAVDRLTSRSVGVEGEFGYRIPIGSSTLDVGAGLAMVRTRIEDFSLANIDYDYRTAKTLRGRLGARFESAVGVFLDTKLFHDFRDNNDLVMRSGVESDTLEANGKGTWFRGELGYGKPGNAGPIGALWVNAGDVHGFGAKLGYRF